MNPGAPPSSAAKAAQRSSSGYHQKALAEIRNSLLPFANSSDGQGGQGQGGQGQGGGQQLTDLALLRHSLSQLLAQGYEEVTNRS